MEGTCKEEKCWLFLLMKELIGDKVSLNVKDCPFFMEMIFTPDGVDGAKSAKLVRDCSSKRSTLFVLEQIYPRVIGIQKSNEQARNETADASVLFKEILNGLAARRRINTQEKVVEISHE